MIVISNPIPAILNQQREKKRRDEEQERSNMRGLASEISNGIQNIIETLEKSHKKRVENFKRQRKDNIAILEHTCQAIKTVTRVE